MTRIAVPYFLADHQSDLDLAVATDVVVTADIPEGSGWSPMLPLFESVANAVSTAVAGGGRPAVISGDCTTAVGTVAGLQRAGLDPAVIWLDAHGDVQTMETTTSGFLGGMPLRILVGYRPELAAAPLGLRAVPESRVVLVDARDLDPPERTYLSQSQIVRTAVDDLTPDLLPSRPLYLHVDLDIVDPTYVPGVRYPAPGGPTLVAVAEALRRILMTGAVAAFGIACTWAQHVLVSSDVREQLESLVSDWERGPNTL